MPPKRTRVPSEQRKVSPSVIVATSQVNELADFDRFISAFCLLTGTGMPSCRTPKSVDCQAARAKRLSMS
jgi:hypothetical protein